MMFKSCTAAAVKTVLAPVKVRRRFARMVAGSMVAVTAVLGLNMVTAGAAAAAVDERGHWKAYGDTYPKTASTSTWACGQEVVIETDVYAELCAIRTPDLDFAQAAVIVFNNRSSLYGAEAAAELAYLRANNIGRWECSRSGVAAKSWSVCFGRTMPVFSFSLVLAPRGGINGVNLPGSRSL